MVTLNSLIHENSLLLYNCKYTPPPDVNGIDCGACAHVLIHNGLAEKPRRSQSPGVASTSFENERLPLHSF